MQVFGNVYNIGLIHWHEFFEDAWLNQPRWDNAIYFLGKQLLEIHDADGNRKHRFIFNKEWRHNSQHSYYYDCNKIDKHYYQRKLLVEGPECDSPLIQVELKEGDVISYKMPRFLELWIEGGFEILSSNIPKGIYLIILYFHYLNYIIILYLVHTRNFTFK